MAAEWQTRAAARCERHWGGCSWVEQKCKLQHTLSELEFTFRGVFRRRCHGCWWRRDEEGDHGSPSRVGRADLQLSEPARGVGRGILHCSHGLTAD